MVQAQKHSNSAGQYISNVQHWCHSHLYLLYPEKPENTGGLTGMLVLISYIKLSLDTHPNIKFKDLNNLCQNKG